MARASESEAQDDGDLTQFVLHNGADSTPSSAGRYGPSGVCDRREPQGIGQKLLSQKNSGPLTIPLVSAAAFFHGPAPVMQPAHCKSLSAPILSPCYADEL